MNVIALVPLAIFLMLLVPSVALGRRGVFRTPRVHVAVQVFAFAALLFTIWVYMQKHH